MKEEPVHLNGKEMTSREADIAHCMLAALPHKDIATELNISRSTLRGECRIMYLKFGAHNEKDLMRMVHALPSLKKKLLSRRVHKHKPKDDKPSGSSDSPSEK